MKFTQFFSILIAIGIFVSCTESANDKSKQSDSATGPNGKVTDVLPKTEISSENTTPANVIKGTMNSTEFGSMGFLLNKSKWAEQVANEKVTFLCPTEKSLELNNRQLVAEFKRPENQDLLDEYIALHVLKGEIILSKTTTTDVETISGIKLKIDRENHTIDGVHYTDREIQTGMGNIIVMDDLLRYPQSELKARAGKRLKKSV